MAQKNFVICKITDSIVLVIPKTWERPDYYLAEVANDLADNYQNVDVCFDLLLKNGTRDRFYMVQLQKGNMIRSSFKRVNSPDSIKEASDLFFAANWNLIEKSILSSAQKFVLKKQLLSRNIL